MAVAKVESLYPRSGISGNLIWQLNQILEIAEDSEGARTSPEIYFRHQLKICIDRWQGGALVDVPQTLNHPSFERFRATIAELNAAYRENKLTINGAKELIEEARKLISSVNP